MAAEPLNLAFMVDDFPVVSETFVTTLAEAVVARGHHLTVLARGFGGADHSALPAREAALAGAVARARAEGRLSLRRMARLAADGPRHGPTLAALWALDRIAGRETLAVTRLMADQPRFDVVHAQFATLGQAAQRHRDYGTLRTRSLIVHLRGYDVTSHVAEHGADAYRRMFDKAELFIANSAHFRQTAIDLGCPADRCIVIGSPIDTDYFAPPAGGRSAPDGRPLRLVSVGRLVEKKGFDDLIEAVARLRATDLDVTLDIVGEGPLRPMLEAQIDALGLGASVTLLGAAPRDAVRAALHRADIGVAASKTAASGDQDAAVNTMKEMMATGLPIAATRHGGIPELARDGENARLAPEADPAALAHAIATLARDPSEWPRMGAAGRAAVIAEFDTRVVAEKTIDAYTRTLCKDGEPR